MGGTAAAVQHDPVHLVFGSAAGFNNTRAALGAEVRGLRFCRFASLAAFLNRIERRRDVAAQPANLITKIYFPRLLRSDFGDRRGAARHGISMVFVDGLMAWYHVVPSVAISVCLCY